LEEDLNKMLDSGIAKMGAFAFILLVSFAGLITVIPAEIVNAINYTNPSKKIPESWNGIELGGYNFTDIWNTTITNDDTSTYIELGGRNFRFGTWTLFSNPTFIKLNHRYGFLLLLEEAMHWFIEEDLGAELWYEGNLDDAYEEYEELEFEVICYGRGWGSNYVKVTSILSFNSTTYETPSIAWYNNDLDILIGINSENTNYQRDIWLLISNLLTFNTLYVFGTTELYAVILNGILASIIYVPIIIFATAIILEVLPF